MKNNKILDLRDGKYMVITDIHGNLDDYQQAIRIYESKKGKGRRGLKGIIFAGDVIHGPEDNDHSKEIIDDIMERKEKDQNIHLLLGNHELIHVLDLPISEEAVGRFEEEIKEDREKYIDFFKSLPLYARTQGGVTVSHGGAPLIYGSLEDTIASLSAITGMDFNDKESQEYRQEFDSLNPEEKESFKQSLVSSFGAPSYETLLKVLRKENIDIQEKYGLSYKEALETLLKLKVLEDIDSLNIDETSPTKLSDAKQIIEEIKDPEAFKEKFKDLQKDIEKYEKLIRDQYVFQKKTFAIYLKDLTLPNPVEIWNSIFNPNEEKYGQSGYLFMVKEFLKFMGEGYSPQRFIISGHIHERAGFDLFHGKQLRINSSVGIEDKATKSYVIVDARRKYSSLEELSRGLKSLYPEELDKDLQRKVRDISKKYKIKTILNQSKRVISGIYEHPDDLEKLVELEKRIPGCEEREKIENGILPRNNELNQNLIDVVRKLEEKSIEIKEITTNGGHYFRVKYNSPTDGKEGVIHIMDGPIIDFNSEYGQIGVANTKEGFFRVAQIPMPVGISDNPESDSKEIMLHPQIRILDKNTLDEFFSFISEFKIPLHAFGDLPLRLAFQTSILEEPYTSLSPKEFLEALYFPSAEREQEQRI